VDGLQMALKKVHGARAMLNPVSHSVRSSTPSNSVVKPVELFRRSATDPTRGRVE
jgi:hypothetical protein